MRAQQPTPRRHRSVRAIVTTAVASLVAVAATVSTSGVAHALVMPHG